MAKQKRKYTKKKVIDTFVDEPEVVETPKPPEPVASPPPPEPVKQEKVVLCDCGNPANPGDHQCWRCSHRT